MAERIHMINISDKMPTERNAVAAADVRMPAEIIQRLLCGDMPKGDVIAAAQLAGIMAAKDTARLLPLCHPLPLEHIRIHCIPIPELERVIIQTKAQATARTGVEMEALTGAAIAALTIYDMCKGLSLGIEIGPIRLLAKSGGATGDWRAKDVGVVVAVSVSQQKGTRKENVPEIELEINKGIKGDVHAGPGPRQASLLALESIERARARGLDVAPGDFAENITTQGLVLHTLPVGTYLLLGEQAVGVVSQIGKECHEPCIIGKTLGECVMPKEGIFVKIVRPGKLCAGDLIQILGCSRNASNPS